MMVFELGHVLPSPELVGGKAARIAKLASTRAVLSPPGLILIPDPQCDDGFTQATWELVHQWIGAWKPTTIICRSSTAFEDRAEASHAGHSLTTANVAPNLDELGQVILGLRQQSSLKAIVIQSQIEVIAAGVAFHERGTTRIEGGPTNDWVTSGRRPTFRAVLESGGGVRASDDSDSPPPLHAICRSLWHTMEALRRSFWDGIDVEWGFAEGALYVFQVRPITAPGWAE